MDEKKKKNKANIDSKESKPVKIVNQKGKNAVNNENSLKSIDSKHTPKKKFVLNRVSQSLPKIGRDNYPKASFKSLDNLDRRKSSTWAMATTIVKDKVVKRYVPTGTVYNDKFEVNTLNEEEEEILSFIMTVDIVRFLLLTTNLFFGLSGLLFSTLGIMYLTKSRALVDTVLLLRTHVQTESIYIRDFQIVGICFLFLGIFICIVFFLGFYSTCTNSRKRLLTFTGFLFINTLIQITLVITIQHPSILKSNMIANMKESMMTDFKQDLTIDDDEIQMPTNNIWTIVQLNFNCCGFYEYGDYEELIPRVNRTIRWNNLDYVLDVPLSCCTTKERVEDVNILVHGDFENMEKCMNREDDYFKEEGCFDRLDSAVKTLRKRVLTSECVISCFNIFSIVFGIFDCWSMGVRKYIF